MTQLTNMARAMAAAFQEKCPTSFLSHDVLLAMAEAGLEETIKYFALFEDSIVVYELSTILTEHTRRTSLSAIQKIGQEIEDNG